jgi:TolA-binding protein
MLRPRKKLAKKEIQEDALVTYYFRVQKLYQKFAKQAQIGGMVVLGLAVLAVLMIRSKNSAEKAAAGKLGLVEPAYFSGEFQSVVPELTSIKDKFSGTRSAGAAVFYLGNCHFNTGNMEQAGSFYRVYIEDYGQDAEFSASSMAGLAAVEESRAQYAKAAEWYEKAGKKYARLYSAPFYLKEAGRCYAMAGEKAKGKSVLQQLMKKYPESSPAKDAEAFMESL